MPDLRDFLFRPTDTFDIRNPVYRPEDKVEVQPLAPETGKRDFLYQYLEQNKEVMGPKTQMFDRYADPDDGTLMAADPVDKAAHGPQMTRKQFSNYMEMRNPGFKSRTDALRMKLINAGILRGV